MKSLVSVVSSAPILLVCALAAPAASDQTAEDEAKILTEAALLETALSPWTGDLEGMVERNMIRIAIPYGIATHFLDGPAKKGPTYDLAVTFEQNLKKKLGLKDTDLTMVVVPARRDEIFQMLIAGKADIAAGTLTVTEERAALVAFSEPFLSGTNEVVITGPEHAKGVTFDALAGTEIHVRASSSFYPHLAALNERRAAAGETPLTMVAVDEILNTEDLVEMVNVGLLPATMADEGIADFLARIFDNVVVHNDLVVSGPNEIGDLDRVVFSFAAYNAGPGNIAKSRKLAAKMGLNPDVWFDNVELAAARAVSREPVIYVRNVYKYYVAYRRIADQLVARRDQVPN